MAVVTRRDAGVTVKKKKKDMETETTAKEEGGEARQEAASKTDTSGKASSSAKTNRRGNSTGFVSSSRSSSGAFGSNSRGFGSGTVGGNPVGAEKARETAASGRSAAGTVLDVIGRGAGQFDYAVASTADFLANLAPRVEGALTGEKAGGTFTGQLLKPVTDATGAFKNQIADMTGRVDQRVQEATQNSKAAKWAADIGSSLVSAVPNAALAMMTAGGSTATQLGTQSTGLMGTVSTAIKKLFQDPMYWTSAAQTLGPGYDEAVADGATEAEALLAATLSTAFNAAVEVGGGVETLPGELRNVDLSTAEKARKWVNASIGEGKEEVVQGVLERLVNKTVFDHDKPYFSTTDENAVFNPKVSAQEGMMGFSVGGILSGGEIAVDSIMRSDWRNGLPQSVRSLHDNSAGQRLVQENNRAIVNIIPDSFAGSHLGDSTRAEVVPIYGKADGGTRAPNANGPGNTPNASLASAPTALTGNTDQVLNMPQSDPQLTSEMRHGANTPYFKIAQNETSVNGNQVQRTADDRMGSGGSVNLPAIESIPSEALRVCLDAAVNGNRGELYAARDAYIRNGLTPEAASSKVVQDVLKRYGGVMESGLRNGMTAGMAQKIAEAVELNRLNHTVAGENIRQNGMEQGVLDAALAMPPDSEARNLAERYLEQAQTERLEKMDALETKLKLSSRNIENEAQLQALARAVSQRDEGLETLGEKTLADFLSSEQLGRLSETLREECAELTASGNGDMISPQATAYIESLKTKNMKLEGDVHPVTGVPFERYQIEKDGKIIEVVAPKFESFHTVQLPEELYMASNRKQFKVCNLATYQAVLEDVRLRELFDASQLYDLSKGITPSGYVWHHSVVTGEMQLVDRTLHEKTGHTGGRFLWGRSKK